MTWDWPGVTSVSKKATIFASAAVCLYAALRDESNGNAGAEQETRTIVESLSFWQLLSSATHAHG